MRRSFLPACLIKISLVFELAYQIGLVTVPIENFAEALAAARALEGLGSNVTPNVVSHLGQLISFLAANRADKDLPASTRLLVHHLRSAKQAVFLAGTHSVLLKVVPVGSTKAFFFVTRGCIGVGLIGRATLAIGVRLC